MKDFLRVMSPKTQFSLSIFFIVFVVAVLGWSAVFLFGRVRNESAEIEAAKFRRASLEMRRSEIKREESSFAELHAGIARIEEAFVGHPLAFFEFLEDLASRNNLAISLSLGETAAAERTERLRITVSGAYRQLLRFLRGVESSPYQTEVRAVALELTDQRPAFSDSLARLAIDLRIISIAP